MKTLTTSVILSMMLLSAGAFAGLNRNAGRVTASNAKAANMTVVTKNAAWPPAGQISAEPCSRTHCIAI